MSFPDPDFARLPAAVRETASRLDAQGLRAWLVGETLAQLVRGQQPSAFELATNADVERCLALFPNAVPTQPDRGVVCVPTGQAPIDLTTLRWGARIEEDLAHRDFTVLAVAWSPLDGELTDPWNGLDDLSAGRLRSVGDPNARLHEDPARILRAARLVSEWGLAPDAPLEQAMGAVAPALAAVPAGRKRAELCRVLLGPGAEAALDLLRRSGVEKKLARDVRDDAAAIVAAMPECLELRLAAWLRGSRSRALLKRLRFGRERSDRVEGLLSNHPLDELIVPTRDRSLLRLQRQLEDDEIEGLFLLRELELAASDDPTGPRKRLEAIRNGLARVRANEARAKERTLLSISGEQVMEWLGCPPGRTVGAALRFASQWVEEDPSRNEPEALRQTLLDWNARCTEQER